MRKLLVPMAVAALLAYANDAAAVSKMAPVDVVMTGGELYFVLEEPLAVEFVRVSEAPAAVKPGPRPPVKALWLLGFDMSTPVKDRKYPLLNQIRYARKYPEFQRVEGPQKLKRNVKYLVEINAGGTMARETFYILSEAKAVTPEPAFERQKGRTYSLKKNKDGSKELVLDAPKK